MSQLTQKLAEIVTKVGVHAAFGDPVDVDGTKIMPVACTWYGFGGGEGNGAGGMGGNDDAEAQGEGSGGGGGGAAAPVGAYVTRDGVTRFEPNIIALLAVGVPFVWVLGRALARVIRALKR